MSPKIIILGRGGQIFSIHTKQTYPRDMWTVKRMILGTPYDYLLLDWRVIGGSGKAGHRFNDLLRNECKWIMFSV